MNIIKLNAGQVCQIFNAMEAECGTDDNIMIPTHFPFNEFTIDIQGGLPIKVKLYEGYGLNKFDFEMQCVLSTGNIGIFEVKCDRYNIKYPKVNGISREAIRDAAESFRDAIWEITAFIMTYQRDRKEKHPIPRNIPENTEYPQAKTRYTCSMISSNMSMIPTYRREVLITSSVNVGECVDITGHTKAVRKYG